MPPWASRLPTAAGLPISRGSRISRTAWSTCALEIGGLAQIWRSWADDNPERMVRGVILDLAPGQESTSLLLSPEGWLIGLTDIEDAENGRLKEPPWCFIKTQFGPVEGHVALVEMLAALKREFLPDLEVSDDGGYWETRDLAELVRKHSLTKGSDRRSGRGAPALRTQSRGGGRSETSCFGTSSGSRSKSTESCAARRNIPRSSFEDDDDFGGAADPEATEKLWDELSKHNRRQQERMQRAIEERRSRGLDDETAFQDALRDVVPDLPDEETEQSDEPWRDDEHPPFGESLADEAAGEGAGFRKAGDDPFEAEEEERHPLLQKAMDLLVRFDSVFRDEDPRLLLRSARSIKAPATRWAAWRRRCPDRDHDAERLSACASCSSSVPFAALRLPAGPCSRFDRAMSAEQFDELFRTLKQMETDIVSELGKVRSEQRGDDE